MHISRIILVYVGDVGLVLASRGRSFVCMFLRLHLNGTIMSCILATALCFFFIRTLFGIILPNFNIFAIFPRNFPAVARPYNCCVRGVFAVLKMWSFIRSFNYFSMMLFSSARLLHSGVLSCVFVDVGFVFASRGSSFLPCMCLIFAACCLMFALNSQHRVVCFTAPHVFFFL